MTDIVNDYFKRYYPDDWQTANYNFSTMLGGMREYQDRCGNTIFPRIKCADGLEISVQGHFGAYSSPRDDFAEHYSKVECGYPSAPIEELMPFIDGESDPVTSVYGYVPVEVVAAIIEAHGGITSTPTVPA